MVGGGRDLVWSCLAGSQVGDCGERGALLFVMEDREGLGVTCHGATQRASPVFCIGTFHRAKHLQQTFPFLSLNYIVGFYLHVVPDGRTGSISMLGQKLFY